VLERRSFGAAPGGDVSHLNYSLAGVCARARFNLMQRGKRFLMMEDMICTTVTTYDLILYYVNVIIGLQ